MKLVAEQVKLLREARRDCLKEREELKEVFRSADNSDMDGLNAFAQRDVQADLKCHKVDAKYDQISRILKTSKFVVNRNTDMVDYGTLFEVEFDEDDSETYLMVDACDLVHDTEFVSSDSDFGQAVLGAKEGEIVEYTVSHNGLKISVPITSILTDPSRYEHFIRERESKYRTSKAAARELALAKDNPKLLENWEYISVTQNWLLNEEQSRLQNDKDSAVRLGLVKKNLSMLVAELPQDDSIGVGSFVTIQLVYKDHNVEPQSFEMINRAFSTELESDYVERISSLGQAIFGLHPGDEFSFNISGGRKAHGYIVSVDNEHNKKLEKVYC